MMALGAAQLYLQEAVAQGKQAPRFEVDPYWPKPMPNNSVLGQAIGVSVDERDHVWMVHRGSDPALSTLPNWRSFPRGMGSASVNAATRPRQYSNSTPPGTSSTRGAVRPRPENTSGRHRTTASSSTTRASSDRRQRAGRRARSEIHPRGKFVAQYGKADVRKDPTAPADKPAYKADSTDMNSFGRVAKIMIDAKTNEGYVADGYLNHRVRLSISTPARSSACGEPMPAAD